MNVLCVSAVRPGPEGQADRNEERKFLHMLKVRVGAPAAGNPLVGRRSKFPPCRFRLLFSLPAHRTVCSLFPPLCTLFPAAIRTFPLIATL